MKPEVKCNHCLYCGDKEIRTRGTDRRKMRALDKDANYDVKRDGPSYRVPSCFQFMRTLWFGISNNFCPLRSGSYFI